MNSQSQPSYNDHVVTRKLKTCKNFNNIEDIYNELAEENKVFSLKQSNNCLIICYDASATSLEEIITIITKHGIEIKRNTWTYFLMGWYKYVDSNIHDNAKHKPHCCNKAPKI